jgi:hypothetical protein
VIAKRSREMYTVNSCFPRQILDGCCASRVMNELAHPFQPWRGKRSPSIDAPRNLSEELSSQVVGQNSLGRRALSCRLLNALRDSSEVNVVLDEARH